MVFNEHECLHVARYLIGEQSGPCTLEASQRAAVSRAYHAAFVYVRNYEMENHGFRPKGDARDHKLLKEFLLRRGDTSIVGDLQVLSEYRGYCDYNKIVLGTKASISQMVSDMIKLSEVLISKLK